MAKFVCKCNHIMRLSNLNNDYEYSFVAEKNIDEIIGLLEENNNVINVDDFISKIYEKRIRVLLCPECKRFWLENDDGTYKSYIQE